MSTKINVAGFSSCIFIYFNIFTFVLYLFSCIGGDFQLAKTAVLGLSSICPDKFSASIHEYSSKEDYSNALPAIKDVTFYVFDE